MIKTFGKLMSRFQIFSLYLTSIVAGILMLSIFKLYRDGADSLTLGILTLSAGYLILILIVVAIVKWRERKLSPGECHPEPKD